MSDQAAHGTTVLPAADTPIRMTVEGRTRLEAELTRLTTVQRPALEQQARRARLFLAPEASAHIVSLTEYDLRLLDEHIQQLTDALKRVEAIPEPPDAATVQVGSRVSVRYEDGTEEELTVVGPYEADPSKGQVSSESPVGKALLGKAPDDEVTIRFESETISMTIVSILSSSATK